MCNSDGLSRVKKELDCRDVGWILEEVSDRIDYMFKQTDGSLKIDGNITPMLVDIIHMVLVANEKKNNASRSSIFKVTNGRTFEMLFNNITDAEHFISGSAPSLGLSIVEVPVL